MIPPTCKDKYREVVSPTCLQNSSNERLDGCFSHLQILPSLGYLLSDAAAVVTGGQTWPRKWEHSSLCTSGFVRTQRGRSEIVWHFLFSYKKKIKQNKYDATHGMQQYVGSLTVLWQVHTLLGRFLLYVRNLAKFYVICFILRAVSHAFPSFNASARCYAI